MGKDKEYKEPPAGTALTDDEIIAANIQTQKQQSPANKPEEGSEAFVPAFKGDSAALRQMVEIAELAIAHIEELKSYDLADYDILHLDNALAEIKATKMISRYAAQIPKE